MACHRYSESSVDLEAFTARVTLYANQITFIGLVSSKNFYRRPRIIAVIAKGGIRQDGTNSGGNMGGRVRGELLGRGTAIMYPVET